MVTFTVIPEGKIGLVLSKDGAEIPTGRILARRVDSDNIIVGIGDHPTGDGRQRDVGGDEVGHGACPCAGNSIVRACRPASEGLRRSSGSISAVPTDC